jgi:hypothetical protein
MYVTIYFRNCVSFWIYFVLNSHTMNCILMNFNPQSFTIIILFHIIASLQQIIHTYANNVTPSSRLKSWSDAQRNSQHSMKLRGLLSRSEQPASSSCPHKGESSPHLTTLFMIQFNIILPSTRDVSKWSPSFAFSCQNFVYVPLLSPACHKLNSLPSSLDPPDKKWRELQIMTLFVRTCIGNTHKMAPTV